MYRKILLVIIIAGLISILIPDDIISENDHHDLGSLVIDHDNTLRLLTWNIKMFPPPYGWLHDRSDRAKKIILSMLKLEELEEVLEAKKLKVLYLQQYVLCYQKKQNDQLNLK